MKVEIRKIARKNHRIISRGVLFCIAPPVPLTQGDWREGIKLRDGFNEVQRREIVF
jgi:hypothetical protein